MAGIPGEAAPTAINNGLYQTVKDFVTNGRAPGVPVAPKTCSVWHDTWKPIIANQYFPTGIALGFITESSDALQGRPSAAGADRSIQPLARFGRLVIVFLLVVSLVPGLFGLIGVYRASKTQLTQTRGVYFMEMASLAAFQIGNIVKTRLESVLRLSRMEAIRALPTLRADRLASEAERVREIMTAHLGPQVTADIRRASGELILSVGRAIPYDGPAEALPPEVAAALRGGAAHISGVIGPVAGMKRSVILYAPVFGSGGGYQGFIEAAVAIDELAEAIGGVRIEMTGYATLVDSNGRVLIGPPPAAGQTVVPESLLGPISRGAAGWVAAPGEGGADGLIFGFAPVKARVDAPLAAGRGGMDWMVVTGQDPEEAYMPGKTIRRALGTYSLALVALALALGLPARKRILKAQSDHQAEVVRRKKAETAKQLINGLQEMVAQPVEELERWIMDTEAPSSGQDRKPARLEKIRGRLDKVKSVMSHLGHCSADGRIKLEPLNLGGIAHEMFSLIDYLAARKNVSITFSEPESPVTFPGNSKLLGVAILNIALNAVRAAPPGGEIRVSVEKEGLWAALKVRDNGRGIPERDMERIFDPFYTTKTGKNGCGLGLCVSKGIVEKHNGKILVNSSKGNGTEVTIKIGFPEGETSETT